VVVRRVVGLVVGAALLAGCGTAESPHTTEPTRTLALRAACPGVHVAYDALVAADPASARVFQESLRRVWEAGVDDTRDAVKPLLDASAVLAGADRSEFPAARDGVYAAVVRLSATCATLGSPILH
jgi:hypothetical protein